MIASSAGAASLRDNADLIGEVAAERQYRANAVMARRFGPEGRTRCASDMAYHTRYLAEAIDAGDPRLFTDYIQWARTMLEPRGVSQDDLVDALELLRGVIEEVAPASASDASSIIADALGDFSHPAPSFGANEPFGQVARAYLDSLVNFDAAGAVRVIEGALSNGMPLRELYTDVLRRSQIAIGELWQANRISVAHEHFATAVTQSVMARLYPRVLSGDRPRGTAVVSAVAGEMHEVGARMVSDLLELDGWSTMYLGANVPARDLVQLLRSVSPRVIGLSITMPYHLPALRNMIEVIRTAFGRTLPIVAGGRPFVLSPALAGSVDADSVVSDESTIAETFRRYSI